MQNYYNSLGGLKTEELIATLDRLGAGELAADGMTMPLWSPWRRTNNRLYEKMEDVNYGGAMVYGQNCCSQAQWWFEGHYIADNVSTSADALGYHQRRSGMIIGVDRQLSSIVTAGVMFAYGQPRAYNRLARVEADDFTLGLYAQWHACEYLYANAFLGYGHQEYDYTNRASGFDTSYGGDAIYASLEFVRPIYYNAYLTLLPLLAVDYQQTWTEGFTDASNGPPAMQYDDGDLAQVLLRVGLNSRYTWTDRVNLTTRLQYAHNFGDTCGELGVSFTGAPGTSTMLRGASLGRDLLNLGIGGEILLGCDGRTRLFTDYDFYVSDHARTHAGHLGIERKW